MEQALGQLPTDIEQVVLVNNAGTIDPIGLAHTNDSAEVSQSIVLNLTAPMLLCGAFINQLKIAQLKKNYQYIVRSGAQGIRGMECLLCRKILRVDHFSSCIDAENEDVKVVSVAPGIIDTGMQEKIRQSDATDFPLIEKFLDYKESGLLSSPEETARLLIEMNERTDFNELPTILDIRNLSTEKE
ncbi:short-chain dehydrogenase/reductase SDR [Planococcus halocryophilus Or1]|uniref:SDR family NAD(P)-dependent oxidoreductase n=1 Tax=Planococcus halocryophilus TaxID=1215089 RepID=UPI0002B8963A|nr:SDR family NAD(P)-dependent oxidoreductase [Planococcus halocryophilus]EMF46157.1 short-chain dehydrogenase/reductase SDR [Planococcus halocryophilus Or1]